MRIVWNKQNSEEIEKELQELSEKELLEAKEFCRQQYLKDPKTFAFLLDIYPDFSLI